MHSLLLSKLAAQPGSAELGPQTRAQQNASQDQTSDFEAVMNQLGTEDAPATADPKATEKEVGAELRSADVKATETADAVPLAAPKTATDPAIAAAKSIAGQQAELAVNGTQRIAGDAAIVVSSTATSSQEKLGSVVSDARSGTSLLTQGAKENAAQPATERAHPNLSDQIRTAKSVEGAEVKPALQQERTLGDQRAPQIKTATGAGAETARPAAARPTSVEATAPLPQAVQGAAQRGMTGNSQQGATPVNASELHQNKTAQANPKVMEEALRPSAVPETAEQPLPPKQMAPRMPNGATARPDANPMPVNSAGSTRVTAPSQIPGAPTSTPSQLEAVTRTSVEPPVSAPTAPAAQLVARPIEAQTTPAQRKKAGEASVTEARASNRTTRPEQQFTLATPPQPVKPTPAVQAPKLAVSAIDAVGHNTPAINAVAGGEGDLAPLQRSEQAAATTQTTVTALAARPDTPQHVARQIAEALQNMPQRPVEISLNPEELGRVRLGVAASEAGIVVSVLAERGETIDLMRRNIHSLEQAFQALGYSDISFSFAGGQTSDGGDEHASGQQDGPTQQDEDTLPQQVSAPRAVSSGSGLDLRL